MVNVRRDFDCLKCGVFCYAREAARAQRSAVLGALVLCLQAEQLPVLRRRRSPKFFFLFAHWGGDRQWSEVELPVAGEGASLIYYAGLMVPGRMEGIGLVV